MARRTKKIDNVIWDLSTGGVGALSAGTSAILFASVGTQPTTLLRMRGQVLSYVDATQAPGGLVQLTMGIIKVPEGSGTTVQYDPATDANAPWIWYDFALLGYEEMVTDVVDVPGATSFRSVIDNKAMRRIRPDEELQFAITNTTQAGALSVNMRYGVRWLQGF